MWTSLDQSNVCHCYSNLFCFYVISLRINLNLKKIVWIFIVRFFSGVTLEHIPRSLSPDGNIFSAPKDFRVYGLTSFNDDNPTHLVNTVIWISDARTFQTVLGSGIWMATIWLPYTLVRFGLICGLLVWVFLIRRPSHNSGLWWHFAVWKSTNRHDCTSVRKQCFTVYFSWKC